MIRAIACAFGIGWREASDILYDVARDLGCEMSCIGCYSNLFKDLHLEEVDVRDMTVEEVAQLYEGDTVIIRIPGHLTCARKGVVMDIWDCRDEIVDRAWVVRF